MTHLNPGPTPVLQPPPQEKKKATKPRPRGQLLCQVASTSTGTCTRTNPAPGSFHGYLKENKEDATEPSLTLTIKTEKRWERSSEPD